jgi:sensor histidine kinase YesM
MHGSIMTTTFFNHKANKSLNHIIITISDNGIGRKKSEEINKNRKKHNSHGIGLVQQKIEIIKLKYNQDIELSIQDLNSTLQSGTVVTLKIPLND